MSETKSEGIRSPLRDLSNSPVNSPLQGGLAGLTKKSSAVPTFGLASLLDNKEGYSSQDFFGSELRARKPRGSKVYQQQPGYSGQSAAV